MKDGNNVGHTTGLFFGSFNPVHIGHMALANYFLELTPIDDLQLVLSPQSPLKSSAVLVSEQHRLRMLEIALAAYPDLPMSVNTIELKLPKPSYTVNTLNELQKQNPHTAYVVLMGADNLAAIEQWKDYKKILDNFELYVYPRIGYSLESLSKKYGVSLLAAPVLEVSATFLRNEIANGRNFSTYFPHGVWDYIKAGKLYCKTDNKMQK